MNIRDHLPGSGRSCSCIWGHLASRVGDVVDQVLDGYPLATGHVLKCDSSGRSSIRHGGLSYRPDPTGHHHDQNFQGAGNKRQRDGRRPRRGIQGEVWRRRRSRINIANSHARISTLLYLFFPIWLGMALLTAFFLPLLPMLTGADSRYYQQPTGMNPDGDF